MEKFSSKFLIVASIAIAVLFIAGAYVFAAYDTDKAKLQLIKYPIKELGSCQDFNECKTYCNKDENIPKCLRFNIKNLYSKEDARDAERLLNLMDKSGLPGKCQNAVECFSYCESAAHTDECWDYAQRHNLTRGYDLETIQRFAKFAREGGKFPGNCQGQDACEAYCGDPRHFAECADFGEKVGIMTKEETDMMRKIARSGLTKFPGNCKNKESCDAYCKVEEHFEECIDFAEKVGMVSKEDVEFARKTHGKTPGDCARGVTSAEEGRRACSAFCAKTENQPVCMDFAVQMGLITAEDAKELSGGGSLEDFNACLPYINEEMLKCFDVLGKDTFEKMKAGQLPDAPKDLGIMLKGMKEVRACLNRNTDDAFGDLAKDFPDATVCLEKELGPSPIERIKSGRISCREFPEMQEKIKACFSGLVESQLDQCLSLSCADVTACFNKLGGGNKKSDQSQIDPTIMKRVDDKINSCVADQIKECLTKDCSEMMACINKFQSGDQKTEAGESKLDPAIEQELTAKMTACIKSQSGGGGGALPPSSGGQQPQVPEYKAPKYPESSQYPQAPGGSSSEIPITPELCANFANTPACSYVGSPDSQNYQLCKKCYPDR